MANLIKIGSAALKSGSNVFAFNKSQSIGALLGSVSGFSNLGLITVDTIGNRLFIASSTGGTINILDLTTYAVLNTSLSGYDVAIDTTGNRLFVAKNSTIRVYNLTTYTFITSLSIDSTGGIDFADYLYAFDQTGYIRQVECVGYSVVATGTVSIQDFGRKGFRVDKLSNRCFCFAYNTGIKVYNLTTFAAVGTITSLGNQAFAGFSINPATNRIFMQWTNVCRITNYTQPFVGQSDSFSTNMDKAYGIDSDDTRIFICDTTTLYIYSNLYS